MVPFLQYRIIYVLISCAVIVAGLFSVVRWGYTYSIDFIGGSVLDYQLKGVDEKQVSVIQNILTQQKITAERLEFKQQILSLRAKNIDEQQEVRLREALASTLKIEPVVLRFESVGPVIGAEAVRKTLFAMIIAIIGILLYMTFAFKGVHFAIAAIVALIHDFLVVIGVYSIISHFYGAQLDTLFVTALLTTMSFSVHDTIVIFDKIREYIRTEGSEDIVRLANKALTETMVRSINNSMTIVFMLLALILLGGDTIRYFSIALMIGTITGTYSSPFVATPVLVWLEGRKKRG